MHVVHGFALAIEEGSSNSSTLSLPRSLLTLHMLYLLTSPVSPGTIESESPRLKALLAVCYKANASTKQSANSTQPATATQREMLFAVAKSWTYIFVYVKEGCYHRILDLI